MTYLIVPIEIDDIDALFRRSIAVPYDSNQIQTAKRCRMFGLGAVTREGRWLLLLQTSANWYNIYPHFQIVLSNFRNNYTIVTISQWFRMPQLTCQFQHERHCRRRRQSQNTGHPLLVFAPATETMLIRNRINKIEPKFACKLYCSTMVFTESKIIICGTTKLNDCTPYRHLKARQRVFARGITLIGALPRRHTTEWCQNHER